LPSSPAFTSADLIGTWHGYSLIFDTTNRFNKSYEFGNFTINSSGLLTVGSYTRSDLTTSTITSGLYAIDGNGKVAGTATSNNGGSSTLQDAKMDKAKTLIASVSQHNPDTFNNSLDIFIKSGGSFATADLMGAWNFYSIVFDQSTGQLGWLYGNYNSDASGNITGGSIKRSDGATSTLMGGTFRIDGNGKLTGTSISSTGSSTLRDSKLDQGKTFFVGVMDYPDSTTKKDLSIAIKGNSASYTTSDLAGTWYLYGVGANLVGSNVATSWYYGTMTVNSSGLITSCTVTDVVRGINSFSNSSLTINSNGEISGNFGSSVRFQDAVMDAGKSIMAGALDSATDTWKYVMVMVKSSS
jgi:hypothetical protein